MVGWGLLGAGLLAGASRRCRRIIRKEDAQRAEIERLLASEDEAARNLALAMAPAEDAPGGEPAAG
jgi:hypothetical protein